MIIPIRCFTCNNMIASKYEKYLNATKLNYIINDYEDLLSVLSDKTNEKKIEDIKNTSEEIFSKLGIVRYCCKRHLLTHVDLIEKI